VLDGGLQLIGCLSLCSLPRGVVLFRPPLLSNKFEESTVAFSEDAFTSNKIKRFIQDSV